jgi:hypothetical protein
VERVIKMARRVEKLERVVYEEKPQCGRCGAGIVGVIPKWRNEKPLCRECAFELEQMNLRPAGKMIAVDTEKTPLTSEEKNKRIALISLLGVVILILLIRIYTIAPLLQAPKPIRQGVTATDSLTDECIEQLWRLSKNLQDGKKLNLLLLCPRSSRQYIITELTDDTIISCPTPEEHGLAKLTVSRRSPIPHALAGDEQ